MTTRDFPEHNLHTQEVLKNLKAIEVDFAYRFQRDLLDLQTVLSISRVIPLVSGQVIKFYKAPEVELEDGNVAEGDLIPLSKVTPQVAETKEVGLLKYAAATSVEAIQRYGYGPAVNETDRALINRIQHNLQDDLFEAIQTAGSTQDNLSPENGFAGAVASAVGALDVIFEGAGGRPIIFVNSMDVAKYLADTPITMQTQFGLNYVEDFMGATLVVNHKIESGKIYATVNDNLAVYYVGANSEGGRAFGMTADSTGFIGITHDVHKRSLTTETVFMTGVNVFPERLDGIVSVEIGKESSQPQQAEGNPLV